MEREDPDDFVSVEVPSLDDEDEGRTLVPVAGKRGGILRRARKAKKSETASRIDEEAEYVGDISQVTNQLWSTPPAPDVLLFEPIPLCVPYS